MCGVLIACVMLLGVFFDEGKVKRLRLSLMTEFSDRFGSFNCCDLKRLRSGGGRCEKLVGDAADIVCGVIRREK